VLDVSELVPRGVEIGSVNIHIMSRKSSVSGHDHRKEIVPQS
jgi:hypothetical protein